MKDLIYNYIDSNDINKSWEIFDYNINSIIKNLQESQSPFNEKYYFIKSEWDALRLSQKRTGWEKLCVYIKNVLEQECIKAAIATNEEYIKLTVKNYNEEINAATRNVDFSSIYTDISPFQHYINLLKIVVIRKSKIALAPVPYSLSRLVTTFSSYVDFLIEELKNTPAKHTSSLWNSRYEELCCLINPDIYNENPEEVQEEIAKSIINYLTETEDYISADFLEALAKDGRYHLYHIEKFLIDIDFDEIMSETEKKFLLKLTAYIYMVMREEIFKTTDK